MSGYWLRPPPFQRTYSRNCSIEHGSCCKNESLIMNSLTNISKSKYSVLAVMSLSLSCLSMFIGPLGYIPGIISGHAARSECKKNPELMGGRTALVGLIIGYTFLVLTILVIALIIYFADISFHCIKVTDPDSFFRFLEELRKFISTIET